MKFAGPIVFSTPAEAGPSTRQAGQNHREELRSFADQLEAEEPSIAQRATLATTWLHDVRPDIRFGIASEFNDERWVIFIYLPEEDRTSFLYEYDGILKRYGGNGLVFEVQEKGDYDSEIFDTEPIEV
ncbi:MAG: hypothetical protein Q8P13_05040 [bacterium]|nr:hypothetical protein [bacterium]